MDKIIVSFILFLFLYNPIHGQKSQIEYRSEYSVSLHYPIFYRLETGSYKDGSLYQLSFEKSWQSSKYKRVDYSLNLNYGLYNDKGFDPFSSKHHEHLYGINFSTVVGLGKHLLELGIGTDSKALWRAIIGYRMYIKDHFVLKIHFMPSTYFVSAAINSSGSGINSYLDLGIGVGYRFNQKDSKTISNFFVSTWNRLSLQSTIYPFSYEEVGLVNPSLVFDLGLSLFSSGNSKLGIYGGFGINNEDILFQTGISYLYGKENHFIETNFNLIFISIPEYYDEYYYYNDYRLLQPQLGYRYEFDFPLFLRIAYAPYIRTLDWKREGGLHHNMVLGVGYRFRK